MSPFLRTYSHMQNILRLMLGSIRSIDLYPYSSATILGLHRARSTFTGSHCMHKRTLENILCSEQNWGPQGLATLVMRTSHVPTLLR
jgi:hypothetical protein